MILEYLPTQSTQDIERISFACGVLPITKILIPANPVNRIYPDSIAVVALLREKIQPYPHLRHIHFIPTIKSSIHTTQSLQSALLTLQYLDITHVAIITGDSRGHNTLNTYHALEILKDMQKTSSFLQKLQIFCAMESHISARNSYAFCRKMRYGVSHFITQPFYKVQGYSKLHEAQRSQNPTMQLNFLPANYAISIEEFLHFYQNLIKLVRRNKTHQIPKNVQFYFGFLPLTQTKQIDSIHAKKLGIFIPKNYKNSVDTNATTANLELFYQIKQYNISIGYLRFRDVESLFHAL